MGLFGKTQQRDPKEQVNYINHLSELEEFRTVNGKSTSMTPIKILCTYQVLLNDY